MGMTLPELQVKNWAGLSVVEGGVVRGVAVVRPLMVLSQLSSGKMSSRARKPGSWPRVPTWKKLGDKKSGIISRIK